MANYTLKALIDSETVQQLYQAHQKVVIVKGAGESHNQISWVTFLPYQINTVTWDDKYQVYASPSVLESTGKIVKTSYADASPKECYVFSYDIFQDPVSDPTLPENTYEIRNSMQNPSVLTFGLAQSVVVNGTACEGNPINAIQVLFNESALFTPYEKIIVFLAEDVDEGMVVTHVSSQSLELDFSQENDITIKYDPCTGRFVKE